jgi:hypothetical protein
MSTFLTPYYNELIVINTTTLLNIYNIPQHSRRNLISRFQRIKNLRYVLIG